MLTLMMVILVSYVLLVDDKSSAKQARWYSKAQLTTGKAVFENHCAQCHGVQAQGLVANWKKRLADGSYPPPPLNGTAHAWHHALPLLLQIVQEGGAIYDGNMPGFADVMNKQEQLAVVAYFQSFWNDDVYRLWKTDRDPSGIPFTTAANSQNKRLNRGIYAHATD